MRLKVGLVGYLDNALLVDGAISVVVFIALPYVIQCFKLDFIILSGDVTNRVTILLITLGATLMGFLLTIITVIITFKKGFDSKHEIKEYVMKENQDEVPERTVFNATISKEEQFYGSTIYASVIRVFIHSVYELGTILLVLFVLQFEVLQMDMIRHSLIIILLFIMTVFALLRSFHIFHHYLKVHVVHK